MEESQCEKTEESVLGMIILKYLFCIQAGGSEFKCGKIQAEEINL